VKSNNLKPYSFVLFLLFLFNGTFAQKGEQLYKVVDYQSVLGIYSKLSKKVNESSGVILYEDCLWTFNDSGGEPEIYKMDKKSGKVLKTVRIKNGENHDWEDITQDDEYIYLGDFGNNRGNRKNLTIYKILKRDIGKGKKVEVEARKISFSYGDQESFTLKRQKNNFDCEAVTNFGDSLIIFSKDWADRKTRMYKLPKSEGTYSLEPVSSFDVNGLITGADYNKETGNIVLAGYKDYIPFVFLFKGFDGNSFDCEKVFRVNFPKMKDAQTEGVVWMDEKNIIITCEETKRFKQSAFRFDLVNTVEKEMK